MLFGLLSLLTIAQARWEGQGEEGVSSHSHPLKSYHKILGYIRDIAKTKIKKREIKGKCFYCQRDGH